MPHACKFLLIVSLLAATAAAQTPLMTERVASGFSNPLWCGSPPGDEDRLFVAEQSTGLIRIVKDGAVLPDPFINLRSKISTGGERGLLGVAFHPDYDSNGYFFVNYTRSGDGATMIERYQASQGNPDLANPTSATRILGPISQPFSNHNGGGLEFGPNDGYLYISTGDGGSRGDPGCRAQDKADFLGKILRVDVDSPQAEFIPPSNPGVGVQGFNDYVWSYGLRNPWRFSFDRANGDMYIGDVGQNSREEVSFQSGQSAGGENYGWKVMEGLNCYSTANCTNPPTCNSPSLVLPIHQYATGSNCTVVGGYVYRGCAIPDLDGTYFFADYCSGRIWSFSYDGVNPIANFQERTAELRPSSGAIGRITSFGEDARGELHIVGRNGSIYRVMAAGTPVATNLGFGTVGSNGEVPVFEVCGLLGVGLSAEFILRKAPPTTSVSLVLSTSNNPVNLPPWGTLVPTPPQLIAPFVTSSEGRVQFTVQGAAGPAMIYGQWLVLDLASTNGLTFSDALEINFP